jgi:hypothetical protein
MATSVFFNNYNAASEQFLLEDLIVESIQIYGIDFYYLPRTLNNLDPLYLQDDISTYERAFQIEMYVKNYEGFEGDGSFMSQFGLEIRDRMTFTISKRVFDNKIGHELSIIRPRESDLIFYPLNQKLFQIKYVENKPIHYPLGSLPSYDLFCELYEYSNERFITGIDEIDIIQKTLSTNVYDYALLNDEGKVLMTDDGRVIVTNKYQENVIDPIADNITIGEEAADIIDFTETNPFGEIDQ